MKSNKEILHEQGYIFKSNLIPKKYVRTLGKVAREIATDLGYVTKASGGYVFNKKIKKFGIDQQNEYGSLLIRTREYRDLVQLPEIVKFVDSCVGKKWDYQDVNTDGMWARISPPKKFSPTLPPHQDAHYSGKHLKSYGIWLPIMDIPPELGSIRLLPKSNHMGLITHSFGFLKLNVYGKEWFRRNTFRMGDLVMFTNTTIHGPSDNLTKDKMRYSIDFRVKIVKNNKRLVL